MFAARFGACKGRALRYVAQQAVDSNATYIGTYTGTSTATLGPHQVGDVFIAFASRDGSSTAPTLSSAGWTNITSGGANTLGYRIAWKVAVTTNETAGTFTNATSVMIAHVRPSSGWSPSIGVTATSASASATNLGFPAATLQNTDDTSWVFGFFCHRSEDITNLSSAPAGMILCDTLQDATDSAALYRTDVPVASWSSASTTYSGTSSAARTFVLELKLSYEVPVNVPTGLQASVSGSDITLSWTDTNGGNAQHRIDTSPDNTNWTLLTTKNAGTNTHTILSASPGTTYYRVRAQIGASSSAYTSSASATVSGASWQLPTGYYMPAKQSMIVIYPRPDNETSTNARHRWAYYDGTNSVEYRIPVGVAFGSAPYRYQLTSAPSGMTIGETYGSANYGVIAWTPGGSVTGSSVNVRVTDQEGNYVDVAWTVSTSSATSRFMFVDEEGDNANSGSISSPKQTIAGVFGSTYAASSNAGVNLYLRAGTYTPPAWTDTELNEPTLRFHATNKPVSLMAFPGESVTLTMSATMLSVSPSGADTFMQGFICDGYRAADNNYRMCMIGPAVRCTFDSIDWINPGYGTAGDDNATMFYGPNPGSFVNYLYIRNSGETGRSGGSLGNSYGLCSLYTRKYVLIEDCYFSGSADAALYVKGTNEDVCVRYCDVNSTAGYVGSLGFSPLGDSNRIEFCYNKFKTNNDFAFYPHEAGAAENVWVYRNSYYATSIQFAFPNTAGPYLVERNALMTNESPAVETGSQVTVSDTECHGNMSSGIMDSTTLLLQGSYLTNWRGRRGHEIWGG